MDAANRLLAFMRAIFDEDKATEFGELAVDKASSWNSSNNVIGH